MASDYLQEGIRQFKATRAYQEYVTRVERRNPRLRPLDEHTPGELDELMTSHRVPSYVDEHVREQFVDLKDEYVRALNEAMESPAIKARILEAAKAIGKEHLESKPGLKHEVEWVPPAKEKPPYVNITFSTAGKK